MRLRLRFEVVGSVAKAQLASLSNPISDLSSHSFDTWFDMDLYRALTRRTVLIRNVDKPALILGSSQRFNLPRDAHSEIEGILIVNRRSGGGAVLVMPNDPIWLDVWIPRGDPLWDIDIVRSTHWIGDWWVRVLEAFGVKQLFVYRTRPTKSVLADIICFAGLGPGEVSVANRKLTGVAQWRCQEGSLFHCALYKRWDAPSLYPLLDLVDHIGFDGLDRCELLEHLLDHTLGLETALGSTLDSACIIDAAIRALPDGLGAWDLSIPES